MQLRKLLFQVHCYIGLIAGAILAFNGLTGAILAFEPQWMARFGPEAQQVKYIAGGERLPPGVLLKRALEKNPGRIPTAMVISADPTKPVKVKLAIQPPSLPGMKPGMPGAKPGAKPLPGGAPAGFGPGGPKPGPGGPPPGFKPPLVAPTPFALVDPYTGNILPGTTPGSRFFESVEHLHRGMWAGNGLPGIAMRVTLAYCVLLLLFMVVSGLYLRWPKGRVLDWRSWFKIHFKLKGRPFLWSLHSVIGTFVLLVYLMTAHTGLMIGRQITWYHSATVGIREALGVAGLPREPFRTSSIAPEAVNIAWRAFQQQYPAYRVARVEFPVDVRKAITVNSGDRQLDIDAGSGALLASKTIRDQDADAFKPDIAGGEANRTEPFFKAFLNGNPLMHTGTRWGVLGQLVMMCAALCMPIMFVSGWMMYLRRRRPKKRPS